MTNSYQSLGAMTLDAEQSNQQHSWMFRGADGTRAEVTVLAADLARVQLLPQGVAPAASWAVERTDWPAVNVKVKTRDGGPTMTTAAMTVEITTDPFRIAFRWPDGASFAEDDPALGMGIAAAPGTNDLSDRQAPSGSLGGSLRCVKRLAPNERIYGAGERASPLDRRGQQIVFSNVDPPQPHGDETRSMYVSVPCWTCVRDGALLWDFHG